MVAEQQQVQSQFVTRVAALPVIESAIGVATQSYNKLKELSPAPIKTIMDVGEKTTNYAIAASQPIVRKVSGPVRWADQIACSGLDMVEDKVPQVKESPEKIMSDVRESALARVHSATEYGTAKMHQLGLGAVAPDRLGEYREQLVGYAAAALAAAEGALDSHLAAAGAPAPPMGAAEDLRARVEHVTAKARLCVAHHATAPFVAAQKRASDGLGRVIEALQVIRALKANVQEGKSVQEIAHELKFDWLAKLLDEAKDQPATQQALFVAQAAAKEAQDVLAWVAGGVKTRVSDTYHRVTALAGDLTASLSSASAANLTGQMVTRLQEQATHLQTLVQQLTGLNLAQYLPEIKAAQQQIGDSQDGAAHQNGKKTD